MNENWGLILSADNDQKDITKKILKDKKNWILF